MAEPANAVLRVGEGRGFVVEGDRWRYRYVITAAHCLPHFPPCHGASHLGERTYQSLLAPLGEEPSVWCECVFVDPIADIAVLCAPDDQDLAEPAEAYEALVGAATPLTVAEPPSKPIAEEVSRICHSPLASVVIDGVPQEIEIGGVGEEEAMRRARRECGAFLLSLEGEWFPCRVRHHPNGMLSIEDAARGIVGGMSGSPIITDDGKAIGIVCIGSELHEIGDIELRNDSTGGGPNPRLMGNLPGWFLRSLDQAAVR